MLLLTLLLQADTAKPAVAATAPAADEKISLFYLLQQGGVLMIPLAICSIILVYVFVERWLAIRKASAGDENFMARVREQVTAGNLNGAKSLCKNTATPEARMIEKGLSRIGKPIEHIEKSMENTGKLEIYKLEKNLGIISTIASIAPLFGFLGTIFGMMILFFDITHKGFETRNFAGGIYTKMVTSAVGLIIGLVAYVCYRYLDAQLSQKANAMEAASAEFLDILQEPAKA